MENRLQRAMDPGDGVSRARDRAKRHQWSYKKGQDGVSFPPSEWLKSTCKRARELVNGDPERPLRRAEAEESQESGRQTLAKLYLRAADLRPTNGPRSVPKYKT